MTSPTHRRRIGRRITVASLSILLLVVAGCASKEQAAQTGAGAGQIKLPDNLVQAAVAKAKEVAGGAKLTGTIDVINNNGGR
jgi:multidrug efflux pump subunit AcrA (membrane-fusion protein)